MKKCLRITLGADGAAQCQWRWTFMEDDGLVVELPEIDRRSLVVRGQALHVDGLISAPRLLLLTPGSVLTLRGLALQVEAHRSGGGAYRTIPSADAPSVMAALDQLRGLGYAVSVVAPADLQGVRPDAVEQAMEAAAGARRDIDDELADAETQPKATSLRMA